MCGNNNNKPVKIRAGAWKNPVGKLIVRKDVF